MWVIAQSWNAKGKAEVREAGAAWAAGGAAAAARGSRAGVPGPVLLAGDALGPAISPAAHVQCPTSASAQLLNYWAAVI